MKQLEKDFSAKLWRVLTESDYLIDPTRVLYELYQLLEPIMCEIEEDLLEI